MERLPGHAPDVRAALGGRRAEERVERAEVALVDAVAGAAVGEGEAEGVRGLGAHLRCFGGGARAEAVMGDGVEVIQWWGE